MLATPTCARCGLESSRRLLKFLHHQICVQPFSHLHYPYAEAIQGGIDDGPIGQPTACPHFECGQGAPSSLERGASGRRDLEGSPPSVLNVLDPLQEPLLDECRQRWIYRAGRWAIAREHSFEF
jgi:hypothetical protein